MEKLDQKALEQFNATVRHITERTFFSPFSFMTVPMVVWSTVARAMLDPLAAIAETQKLISSK